MLHNTTELSNFDYTTAVQGFHLFDTVSSDNARDLHSVDSNAQVIKDKDGKSRLRRVVSAMRNDVEISTIAVTSPPIVMEKRRKPGVAGSSAPLLNYIFDTYSNTHQHRNEK